MPDALTLPTMVMRAAPLAPTTVNEETCTVSAVIATETPVLCRGKDGRKWYEVLPMAALQTPLPDAAPLLDSHQQKTLSDQIGIITNLRVEGRQLVGDLTISARCPAVWADVKAGVLRAVSVGASVEAWTQSSAADGTPILTAAKWRLVEASLVTFPADAAATTRSSSPMPDTVTAPPEAAESKTEFKACPTCETPSGCKKLGGCVVDANGGGEAETATTDTETTTRAMSRQQVRALQRSLGLGDGWASDLITRGATEQEVRAAAFAALATGVQGVRPDQPRIQVLRSADDPYTRATWMGEALYVRSAGTGNLSEPARQYAYASPADMARELLTLRGVSTVGMAPAAIITRSLNSTSDFPIILGEVIGRTLRTAYAAAPSGIRAAARVTSARDFRTKTSVQLSEAPILKRLSESGEITAGSMAEASETYKVETFARKVGITRQALVNDDLGAFSDLARRFGQAAAETEAVELVALLVKNAGAGPLLSDGAPLFHASRHNIADPAAAISDASLSAARAAMRTRKGLSGQIISAPPRYLVVPAALETTAEKWLTAIQATAASDVNPFGGKLELLVEPRLDAVSATRWYLCADPAVIDGLEIAYLTGSNGPLVEPVKDADTDGVTLKVLHDFGVGFVEWRSWHANAGA
jgi:phage major head subunit gpT-like protein/phage head maturation protease